MGRRQSSLAAKRGSGLILKLKFSDTVRINFFALLWNENLSEVCETSQGSSSISSLKPAQVKGYVLFTLWGFF